MVYETFLNTIQAMVQNRLDGRAQVSLQRVLKNNGLLLDGLTISAPTARLSPTVYLNSYYDEAEQGLPLSAIAEQILLLYEEEPVFPQSLGDSLTDFSSLRERIVYKLINANDNSILLSSVPHYRYLDLAIVFYLIVAEQEEGQMTALIHSEHLNLWNTTLEELSELAQANTPRLLPACITPIEEAICQIDPDCFPANPEIPSVNLYVLSNQKGIHGAACILYPEVLKQFAEKMEDDLIVLPSSIHEVLLTPASQALPQTELNHMIRSVNASDVPQEDRLSDHVYFYSRSQSCLYLPSRLTSSSSVPGETGNLQ